MRSVQKNTAIIHGSTPTLCIHMSYTDAEGREWIWNSALSDRVSYSRRRRGRKGHHELVKTTKSPYWAAETPYPRTEAESTIAPTFTRQHTIVMSIVTLTLSHHPPTFSNNVFQRCRKRMVRKHHVKVAWIKNITVDTKHRRLSVLSQHEKTRIYGIFNIFRSASTFQSLFIYRRSSRGMSRCT